MSLFRLDSYSLLTSCPQCTLTALNRGSFPLPPSKKLTLSFLTTPNCCVIFTKCFAVLPELLIDGLYVFIVSSLDDLWMERLRTVHVSVMLSKLLLDTWRPALEANRLIHQPRCSGVMESHGHMG